VIFGVGRRRVGGCWRPMGCQGDWGWGHAVAPRSFRRFWTEQMSRARLPSERNRHPLQRVRYGSQESDFAPVRVQPVVVGVEVGDEDVDRPSPRHRADPRWPSLLWSTATTTSLNTSARATFTSASSSVTSVVPKSGSIPAADSKRRRGGRSLAERTWSNERGPRSRPSSKPRNRARVRVPAASRGARRAGLGPSAGLERIAPFTDGTRGPLPIWYLT